MAMKHTQQVKDIEQRALFLIGTMRHARTDNISKKEQFEQQRDAAMRGLDVALNTGSLEDLKTAQESANIFESRLRKINGAIAKHKEREEALRRLVTRLAQAIRIRSLQGIEASLTIAVHLNFPEGSELVRMAQTLQFELLSEHRTKTERHALKSLEIAVATGPSASVKLAEEHALDVGLDGDLAPLKKARASLIRWEAREDMLKQIKGRLTQAIHTRSITEIDAAMATAQAMNLPKDSKLFRKAEKLKLQLYLDEIDGLQDQRRSSALESLDIAASSGSLVDLKLAYANARATGISVHFKALQAARRLIEQRETIEVPHSHIAMRLMQAIQTRSLEEIEDSLSLASRVGLHDGSELVRRGRALQMELVKKRLHAPESVQRHLIERLRLKMRQASPLSQ